MDPDRSPSRRTFLEHLGAVPAAPLAAALAVAEARADLPARATPILETTERRTILARILDSLGHGRDLEAWVRESPLVEVTIVEDQSAGGRERR